MLPNDEVERYGFTWGDVQVTCCMSDEKFGKVIGIETPKGNAFVWITPSGLIRMGKFSKPAGNVVGV